MRVSHKGDTLTAELKQMLSRQVARTPVFNRNKVVMASLWIWQKAAVQKHDRNSSVFQQRYNRLIYSVIFWGPFQRSKKHSGNLFHCVLPAELQGLRFFCLRSRRRISPKQGVLMQRARFRHSLANRPEDLCLAQ